MNDTYVEHKRPWVCELIGVGEVRCVAHSEKATDPGTIMQVQVRLCERGIWVKRWVDANRVIPPFRAEWLFRFGVRWDRSGTPYYMRA